uniref:NYN domain-containing protein n=2 Tax=Brassica oleracea TaxID=3712 RepID=A0A0D3AU59_BRAOL
MPVSYPISEFVVADTGVFWDIAYCPIPGGLGPEKIYQNIKLALKNMGYYGKLSIFAYGDENQNPKDIETGGIKCVFTGDEQTRRSLNTNILLAQPENVPHPADEASRPLLCNVSEVWIWKSLATGEKPIYRSGGLQDVGDASACSGSSQGVGD